MAVGDRTVLTMNMKVSSLFEDSCSLVSSSRSPPAVTYRNGHRHAPPLWTDTS